MSHDGLHHWSVNSNRKTLCLSYFRIWKAEIFKKALITMVGTQLQLLCGLTGSCPDCSVSPRTVCLALCFGKKSSLCDWIARTIWKNVVVQLQSPVWLFATPWTAAGQAPLSFTSPWSLLKFSFIQSVGKMWATKFWPRGLVPPDWSLPVGTWWRQVHGQAWFLTLPSHTCLPWGS